MNNRHWYDNIERIKREEKTAYGFKYAGDPTLVKVMKNIFEAEKNGATPDPAELKKLENISGSGIGNAANEYRYYCDAKKCMGKPGSSSTGANSLLDRMGALLGAIFSSFSPLIQTSQKMIDVLPGHGKLKNIAPLYCQILGLALISLAVLGLIWPSTSDLLGIGDSTIVAFNLAAGLVALFAVLASKLRVRAWAVSYPLPFRIVILLLAIVLLGVLVVLGFYVHGVLFFVIFMMIMIAFGRFATTVFSRYYGFSWPLWFFFSLILSFPGLSTFLPDRTGMEDVDLSLFSIYLFSSIAGIWISLLRGRKKQFIGSQQHLRFGKVVAEGIVAAPKIGRNRHLPLLELHPIFAALFNETGGAIGVGGTGLFSTNTLLYIEDGVLAWHGIVHDAAGFLCKGFHISPGYEYRKIKREYRNACCESWFLAGQWSGILYWAKILNKPALFEYTMQLIDRLFELPFYSMVTGLDLSRLNWRNSQEGKNTLPENLLAIDNLEERGLVKYQGSNNQGSIHFFNDELIINLAAISAARREIICTLDSPASAEYRYYETHYEEYESRNSDEPSAESVSRKYHFMVGVTFPSENEISLQSIRSREELAMECERFFTQSEYPDQIEATAGRGKITFKEYVEKGDHDEEYSVDDVFEFPVVRKRDGSWGIAGNTSKFETDSISPICQIYLESETTTFRTLTFRDFRKP